MARTVLFVSDSLMAFYLKKYRRLRSAFTLIDQVFAVAIVSGFFAALYALNGQCLYLLSAGREMTSAQQALQDRMEQIRNLQWANVNDPNYVANNLMNTPSPSVAALGSATETLVVNSYPIAVNPPMQITRSASGTVTITSTNSAIVNGDLVRIDVTLNWLASPGPRARSASSTTVWGENTR